MLGQSKSSPADTGTRSQDEQSTVSALQLFCPHQTPFPPVSSGLQRAPHQGNQESNTNVLQFYPTETKTFLTAACPSCFILRHQQPHHPKDWSAGAWEVGWLSALMCITTASVAVLARKRKQASIFPPVSFGAWGPQGNAGVAGI